MYSWSNSHVRNRALLIHYVSGLNSSYEVGTSTIEKTIDTDHEKGVLGVQISELDTTFQQFSVSRPV
jgi:hypothetical protein